MTWRCPRCGSDDLLVVARIAVQLIQDPDGNFQTDTIDSDHDWDDESLMLCRECNEVGSAGEFQT